MADASNWQTLYNVDGTTWQGYAIDAREMVHRFPKVWSKAPWPAQSAAPVEQVQPVAPVLKGAALRAQERKAEREAAQKAAAAGT